ncbi:jmjC domain-containing protein 8 isoform X1 [Taeniopygia guttata]|uniref:jmjC domain-containing protein 8 isoform X1 n=1 Tax=Taeniopygia guttata TaxID=59729 RepID=UPI003BB9A0FE
MTVSIRLAVHAGSCSSRCPGAGPHGGGAAAAAAAAAAAGLGPARRLHRPSGRRLAGGHGAGGATLHRGASGCLPHLPALPAAVRLLPATDPRWGHGQFGLPSPLHPGEAAGRLRALPGAAQHGQHLLVPQSGCAVPGVRGAAAEAAGPGPPGQRWVAPSRPPQPPPLAGLSSRVPPDTLYFFGDNNFTEWGPLFQHYVPPPFRIPGTSPAYSFGIAGSGSGVPFHWHGPGFSEVIFGRKRWFLYPPDQTPHFHPNETTLAWLQHTYPTLPPAQRPLECTLRPGEVLYFPDRWWHATLNLDTSVFISTFLG